MRISRWLLVAVFCISSASIISCGKSGDADGQSGESADEIRVKGFVKFGSQCPYGTISRTVPHSVGLWECPADLNYAEFTTPPPDLVLQGDCKEMTLSIRSGDRSMDSAWEVLPDGSFSVTLDTVAIGFRSDRDGGSPCTAFAQGEVWGKMDCQDRDKAVIHVNSLWWVAKGKRPDGFMGAACNFRPSCYLFSEAKIRQCM